MTTKRIPTRKLQGGNQRATADRLVRLVQAVVPAVAVALSIVAALAVPPIWSPRAEETSLRPADSPKDAAGMLPAKALAGEFAVLDSTAPSGR